MNYGIITIWADSIGMKKITLVNPPLTGKERYGSLAKGGVYMPNLGLGYLASVLRRENYRVDIVDCEALNLDTKRASEHILRESSDFVGLTATTVSINKAVELATALKDSNPRLKILIGGPHLTSTPDQTMLRFSQFDIGIIGEGELTIVELLNALADNKDISAVDGLIYRISGSLTKTRPRTLIKDLDRLPYPAWDLYPDLARYYQPSAFGFRRLPSISLVTSRGCPFCCSFCSQSLWGGVYREHSPEYVMEMMRILYHKYKIKDLAIYDDTFGVNRTRLIKFCQLLIREKLDLVWSCNLRANMADAGILKLMKEAGCWGIAYGIESGSQKILDFLKKGVKKEEIQQAMRNTKKAGIISKGYIMVGTLLETEQTLRETLDYVLSLDMDLLTVNHFSPFPGTLDYERADKFGYFNKDWRLFNQHSLVFIPNSLRREDLEFYRRKITRRFYLRPKILLKFLRLAFRPVYLKLLLNGALALMRFLLKKDEGFSVLKPIYNH